jgi:hypothetical protein
MKRALIRRSKEAMMVTKRGTKAIKRIKNAKDLGVRTITARHASGVKGGFEIKDFSFGVENPTTIGSASNHAPKKK